MATTMPTGAKAMAAITFAVLAWLTANAYVPNMPEAQSVGNFREFTALLGGLVGWKVMGNSVGKGYVEAVGSGWKTVVVLVFFWLLFFAIYEMLQQSVRMRYDGPFEAIIDVFKRMMQRSVGLWSGPVIGVMVIGGAIAGILTENANRRWR
ncbi:TrgA family protein [Tabrizicola sp.]|uniref:TrgA family protein n=1 Tax=Tabrizicola sp. TaxID=2005166 RepID=UPI00263654A4|nr:TrgA family protein [Tabrizicola sp.]MDM7931906.1 TrgA family protein [Tabrizicola sp.]